MSDTLLLDTHIALWLDNGDGHLRSETRNAIDDCWLNGGIVLLSAVTVWEIAMLVDTERIALDVPVDAWVARFVGRPGTEHVPLDHTAAARAYDLHPLEHRDPADRLLIATAVELGCPFVTYDRRIMEFGRRYGSRYGFRVAA
jgi:PIN domain nuclease of toxin-antitoxin system